MLGVTSQDAISAAVERLAHGPGDPGPVRRGARPDRHRRPRRGVRRAAGAGAEAPRRRAPRSSAARSAPPRRPCRTSSASTSPTSATCSTTWTSATQRPDLDADAAAAAGRGRGRVPAGAATSTRPTRTRSPSSWCASAVEVALPALEIVDSRIDDWDIKFTDTVADNASSGLYVVGSEGRPLDELEPRDVEMSLTINGEVRSSGNGAACLGDPLEALRWLAVQCHRFGDPLRAGQLVLSGALGPFVPFAAGGPGGGVHQRVRRRSVRCRLSSRSRHDASAPPPSSGRATSAPT